MDNREILIDIVKGCDYKEIVYVKQADGSYKYFDQILQKMTGQSLTQSELKQKSFVVASEEQAKQMIKLGLI